SSVDWTTASSEWTDFDDKYELFFDTTSVSPLSGQTQNITGLHGNVTYYFRLWTRDEDTGANSPGNWSLVSNASTVTVTAVLGISIFPGTYDYGSIDVSSAVVNGTTITVTNLGNITETYSLESSSAVNAGGGTGWTINPANPETPGSNIFSLSAGFYGVRPSTDSFNTEVSEKEDALLETTLTCTTTDFSIAGAQTQTGANVPKSSPRNIWFLLKTPTETSTRNEKTITVTITAGTP
ncbi:MAG: hypothetical protein ABIH68_06195, partial [bacterium]